MKAKKSIRLRLTVAEVEDMIESLDAAKTVRDLTGIQRRRLQNACDALVAALNRAQRGEVRLSASVVVKVLRCATMTQTWLSSLLAELSVGKTND